MLPHKFISLHTSLAEANSNLKRIEENYKKFTETGAYPYRRQKFPQQNLMFIANLKENAQAKRDALAQEMNTYIEQQVAEYNKDSFPSGVNPHEGSDAILENKKIEDPLVVTDKIDKDLFLDTPNIEKSSIKVWLNYTIILFILPLLILIIHMLSNNSPVLILPSP